LNGNTCYFRLMKNYSSLLFFLFISAISCAQQITFQKTFGGGNIEQGYSIQQTSDGGYIIAGGSASFGSGIDDVYLIKTNANGNSLWIKTFGGTDIEEGNSIQQTTDGGFIISGYTQSFGAGNSDVYLIKTDANGDALWTKIFGGTGFDWGNSVQQTIDGGYIVTGITNSFGAGYDDVYLIKTDANGNSLWTKTFGGTNHDLGFSVQQTTDGGYIIIGKTYNFGAGDMDVYLIKTDVNGDALWTKTFGGTGVDEGYSVQQTTDAGYVITGWTNSFGAGTFDVYLIKTDTNGDSLWTKTFGGTNVDVGVSVQQTTDGGYIVTGYTTIFGAGTFDVYLIKTDANGDSLWTKTFGGINTDYGYSVQQTSDGGYIIIGSAQSFGSGSSDIYLIKTDSMGNSGCNQTNPATIVTTPATQVTSPATIVNSPPTIVTNPATVVGSGGTVTTLCTTVSIQYPISNFNFPISISPNPATPDASGFTITFPHLINKGVIEIYNVLGEKVVEESVVNASAKEIRMNPAYTAGRDIAAGIYVVKVIADEKHYSAKLAVE